MLCLLFPIFGEANSCPANLHSDRRQPGVLNGNWDAILIVFGVALDIAPTCIASRRKPYVQHRATADFAE